jgi:predicted GH43/DUF377 family glycosyl hydrolase
VLVGWWFSLVWLGAGGFVAFVFYCVNDRIWKIPFFPYDRILSAYSIDGINWTREPGVRLEVGGLHASVQVYAPVVVKMQRQWRMYYRAGGNDSSIASAISDDGLVWREEAGWRLGAANASARLEPHCALAVAGGWHLYYSACADGRWTILRAQSTDGLLWRPEGECSGLGEGDVKDACVIATASETRIYFRRGDNDNLAFFTGVSADGLAWCDIRQCTGYTVAEFPHVACPRVLRQEEGWRMYFSEWSDESFIGIRIASARSLDGVHWQREEGLRLTPGGRYDPLGVFCPDIVATERGWRMYYGGFWQRHFLQPLTLYRHRGLRRFGKGD